MIAALQDMDIFIFYRVYQPVLTGDPAAPQTGIFSFQGLGACPCL